MKTKELKKHLDRHPVERLAVLVKRSGLAVIPLVLLLPFFINHSKDSATAWLTPEFITASGLTVQNVLEQNRSSLGLSFGFEKTIYASISSPVVAYALEIDTRIAKGGKDSFFLTLAPGLLRLCLLLATGGRVVIVVFLISLTIGWFRPEPYSGFDFLGETGNKRLFFSGLKIPFGSQKQIPGLATLNSAPESQARQSALYQTLKNFNATSHTALELIEHLLFYVDTPGSLELDLTAAQWTNSALSLVLEAQLGFQAKGRGSFEPIEEEPFLNDLRLTLPPTLREALAYTPPELVALIVLSVGASKILEFQKFNDRWQRTTQYPELSARAILNSTIHFGHEFFDEARTVVRQALIYSSRSTGETLNPPARNMDAATLGLRQLAELLYIDDEQDRRDAAIISAFLNEAEELIKKWEQKFIKTIEAKLPPSYSCFLAVNNVLYVPLCLAARLFEEIKSIQAIATNKAYKRAQELKASRLRTGKAVPVHWQSIPLCLNQREIKEMADEHRIAPADIKLWLVLRPLLKSSYWIKGFIDGEVVSPSGLIRASFGGREISALIPINTDKLTEAALGQHWRSRFHEIKPDGAARTHTKIYSEPQAAKRVLIRRVK